MCKNGTGSDKFSDTGSVQAAYMAAEEDVQERRQRGREESEDRLERADGRESGGGGGAKHLMIHSNAWRGASSCKRLPLTDRIEKTLPQPGRRQAVTEQSRS